ncbi:uncharacterized protein LOC130407021 [Triplophysa dalaica]|uniref:uncharacterized protein LOC130407021 n=1 Tax=Triplophysa dalaica TaxID=1582913 RepID=UPI0024DFA55F|nr:uncharacterized protein LOC130407021 [Triplophysa dalaica]
MINQSSAFLLFITATLFCGKLKGMDSIEGNCNDVIRLPCKAIDQTNKYRYSMWYKIITEKNRTAIIKKKSGDITHYNNYNNSASLGEKETLELQRINLNLSGIYLCYLAADVGGQNVESFIRLNISECMYLSTSQPSTVTAVYCPSVLEFSVPWALLGFFLISLTKIILCIITVGVCNRVILRGIQRKQEVRGFETRSGTKSSWKK